MKGKIDKSPPNWIVDWPIGLVFLEIYLRRAPFLKAKESLSEGEEFNDKHMASEMRVMLKEMERMVPRSKGGRKRAFSPDQISVIGREIDDLVRNYDELDRPKAIRFLAGKKEVSNRTMQRADKIYREAKLALKQDQSQ